MCVPPSWLVATPWLVPILFKTLGEGPRLIPRRGSSPLLIVPTPEGWKAEYTLVSRMQIHESLTVLALLTRGEARTSDPWICSLMLYHLSYLTTTYIYTYIHTYIHTDHHLLNGLFSHGGREKYPPAALGWVLAVPNLIHTGRFRLWEGS